MIKPTIGRVVIVKRGTSDANSDGWPAFVNRVWSDSCINVAGFNEWGTAFSITSIRLLQDDEPAPEVGPWAEWMPYQKAQAEKHASAGVVLTPPDTTFQDRVRAERAELDERLDKLVAFRSTDTFAGLPVEEQERLDDQRAAMTDYSNVLHERIAAFEPAHTVG